MRLRLACDASPQQLAAVTVVGVNFETELALRRDVVVGAMVMIALVVRHQVAGDAFGEPLGTGFLVGGPFDLVKSPDVNLTLMQRQDELADMVNTLVTTSTSRPR